MELAFQLLQALSRRSLHPDLGAAQQSHERKYMPKQLISTAIGFADMHIEQCLLANPH